jgi:sec-independent protein translocase protein TatB
MEVFGIGPGEFLLIAIVGVLLIGPERLPKMMAEAMKWLAVLRQQATNARREIAAVADLDPAMTDELRRSVAEIAELHPKRIAASLFDDATNPMRAATPPAQPTSPAPTAPPQVNSFGASAASSSFAPRPADAALPAREESAPAAYDTDAT